MKKVTTAFLAMALSVPAIAFAQDTQNDKRTQQQMNQAAQTDQEGSNTQHKHHMSGVVSNNGKTLTSDNTSYIVSNSGKLKNYDDQSVTVKYIFNTDSNSIRILSVSPAH